MNPEGRIEKLNQAVRAFAVVVLILAFVAAFLAPIFVKSIPQVVSSEAFLVILNTVLVWWFKSRDEQLNRADTKSVNGGPNVVPTTPAPPTPRS